jgi:parallel beta-helix repeat protein
MKRALITIACCLMAVTASAQVREIGQVTISATGATIVSAHSIEINEPGTYRLVSNITVDGGSQGFTPAIIIRSDRVTLDLNGFHVEAVGTNAIVTGFPPRPMTSIVVMNGTVRSVESGVVLDTVGNCRVEGLVVENVGRNGIGIRTGGNCIIRNNTVSGSATGISCIFCLVEGNTVSAVGPAGIQATNGSVVLGNRVSAATGVGLLLDATTGYGNNVLSFNSADVSGGVQIGTNLCATNGLC